VAAIIAARLLRFRLVGVLLGARLIRLRGHVFCHAPRLPRHGQTAPVFEFPPVNWDHMLTRFLIEEYARHNGHADLIRELIDGVTGD
jgi:Protein of unknown function (DUF664)